MKPLHGDPNVVMQQRGPRVAPLIAKAWEEHHRRRNRFVIAALVAVVVAALVYSVSGADR